MRVRVWAGFVFFAYRRPSLQGSKEARRVVELNAVDGEHRIGSETDGMAVKVSFGIRHW